MSHYLYALLLLASLVVPLAFSFERQVRFYRKWFALFAGILVAGVVFIAWDVRFTALGVWWFNPNYVSGAYWANLPLEEWLFFVVIPYACFFIYEVVKIYGAGIHFPRTAKLVSLLLMAVLLVLAFVFWDRLYTRINFLYASFVLGLHLLAGSHKSYLSQFYMAYLISLVPFLVVNGVLTAQPVVGYNNAENLALRVFTIPVEDFIYLLGHLLSIALVYELILALQHKMYGLGLKYNAKQSL